MKKFLLKILSLMTASSLPVMYSPEINMKTLAVGESSGFELAFPDFEYIIGQHDGKPVFSATGTQYYNTDIQGRTAATLPSRFDMRDYGTVSSVKNQKSYGTCWTHSSAASAESGIIGAVPSADLSELHTAFYSYYGDDQIITTAESLDEHLNWGGSTGVVANLWSQWIGPVNENRLPYENTAFFNDSGDVAAMQYTSDYHLENAYLFDFNDDRTNVADINSLVKQFIYDGHAVDVSFYHNYSETFNSGYNCSYTSRKSRFANHAVTIAGWDDDFPAENFSKKPEHDGAWLVKNSWGYGSGSDGYIWISYDDRSLCQFAVYELGDNDNYSMNYHHDTFVPTQLISAQRGLNDKTYSYMANVFTAESDMQIDAVATYFQNASTDYEITIYTGLTDETDPSSGTPSAMTSGHQNLTGYMTVGLSESVQVKSSEKFGVVVKLDCNENPFVIPVESSLFIKNSKTGEITDINTYSSNEQIQNHTNHNESFYSADGENWSDTFGEEQIYTDEEKDMVLEALKAEIYDGISETDTEELQKADELYNNYKTLFATGDLCITVGNVSLKAFGNPSGTVGFSHISGEVPEDEAVSLSADGDIFVSVNDSEYVPYTEPLKITEKTKISAYTDPMVMSERTYTPAKAGFSDICCKAGESGYSKARKISDSEYQIDVTSYDNTIKLYLVTGAEILMDGIKVNSFEYTDEINVGYGEKTITFELEQDGKLPDTVTLKIVKNPVSFSLTDEKIVFPEGFSVTAEDGTEIRTGDNVGKYAGQEITVVYEENSEKFVCKVPDRAVLPELETDYYYETLGFIPNDMAELLEYSVVENPKPADYTSAHNRLIDGTWINSGMVMNKAFRVIPDEKITFRISAGNGMFASEPVTYEIPSAVSAPENIPEFTEKDGVYSLSGYDYETAVLKDSDIDVLAEKWGYSATDGYIAAIGKRFGIGNAEKIKSIAGSEWQTCGNFEKGQTVAVRLAATDGAFASKCRFVTVGGMLGDVNDDGMINAEDASAILIHYASVSTDGTGTISDDKIFIADYNNDGFIDSQDATDILIYYAEISVKN